MIKHEFNNIAITGLACCVPENVETLDKYYDIFGKEAVQKFSETTGIIERHVAVKEQTSSDLAFVSADKLLNSKQINRDSIGALVFVTQTPDYRIPATSYVLQDRLGLSQDCMCFDVNLGCSAYVYGLGLVSSIMSNSNIDTALLLTGDTITKYVAPEDKSVCMLLADAASASLLQKTSSFKMQMSYRSHGNKFKSVIVPSGACRNMENNTKRILWEDGNVRSNYDLYMGGTDVFSYAMTDVPKFIKEFMHDIDKQPEQYDALIMHQANLYLMKQVAKRSGFSMEKLPISIDRFGNTSGSCIPVTIVDAFSRQQCVVNNQIELLLAGFGVGMSQGIVDLKIDSASILPMIYSNEYYSDGMI